MQEAGSILHLAKSGRLIVKLRRPFETGTVLVDPNNRPIAKVLEVIGPTRSPYASTIPLTSRLSRASKDRLFVRE